jgi:hypothetical protein
MITTCFDLEEESYYSNYSTIVTFFLIFVYCTIITWRWPLTKAETCRDHREHTIKHIYRLLRTKVLFCDLNSRYPTGQLLSNQNCLYLLQSAEFWQHTRSSQSDLLSRVMDCVQVHNCQMNITQVTSVNVPGYQQSGLHGQNVQVPECLKMIPAA